MHLCFQARLRRAARFAANGVLLLLPAAFAPAQRAPKHERSEPSAQVVMLSDIHFDPFQDPARVAQLRTAPIEAWPGILRAPASATQGSDWAALQKQCPVHGLDTSWTLLAASLGQSAAQQGRPLFVTVSGDLLAHEFDCKIKVLAPEASADDRSGFAVKTVDFVAAEVRRAFPGSPVYLALGNNDSGCSDYHETPGSPFLQHAAATFAAAAGTKDSGQAILRDFTKQGDYNVALPAPMQDARLIVLQDIFESAHYKTCGGTPEPSADETQMAWLSAQLAEARKQHQHVWVMAHVPPGVDMYSTVRSSRGVCSGQPPAMFLASEKLADVLTAFPDVITLAVFAHSHADELRFLHAAGANTGIAVKLVGSISPVNGNQPSFTLAQVEPHSAQLLDYTVFLVGTDKSATKEYSFRETYKLPSFTAPALQALTAGFLADTAGSGASSQAYQHLYFPGDTGLHAAAMQLFWRAYACSLREDKPDAYRTCACPASTDAK